jgi:hypothetical protein
VFQHCLGFKVFSISSKTLLAHTFRTINLKGYADIALTLNRLFNLFGGTVIMANRFKITARILPDGQPFTATGQEGRTLLLLHEKGVNGVVAYDFKGGPPFRLPAYVWSLKRKHGLSIETKHDLHEGGWHGRFVLHTLIEIAA